MPNQVIRRIAKHRIGNGQISSPMLLEIMGCRTEDGAFIYFRSICNETGVMRGVDPDVPGWVPALYFSLSQDLQQCLSFHNVLAQSDIGAYAGEPESRINAKCEIEMKKMHTMLVIEAA